MSEDATATAVRRERFAGGPASGFCSSLAADRRLFAADLAVDRAHVVMLAERGVLADGVAAEILQALNVIEVEGHGALPDGEDVHEAIETAVIDRVGPAGGRMHTARSRNDEVATCIRYRLREDVLDLGEALADLRATLLSVAGEHRETVAPGYTHGQPAQPTTVAHHVCSYERALARDGDRLLDAYGRLNRCPLGAAALAGTPFDVDRERTAALLGFDGVVENAMDAVSARDALLETTSALATAASHCASLAQDLIDLAGDGLVDLDDDYASTSSIMPQKKNPDTLELVRAVAGDAGGELAGLYGVLTGLPRAYNRDLQRATPHVWRTVDAVQEALAVTAGAVETAEFDEPGLAAAAAEGFATATGVADLLAMGGVPFRSAHETVATAAAAAEDGPPSMSTLDETARAVLDTPLEEYVDPAAVREALDPAASVAMRDSRGGPAPGIVEDHIAAVEGALAEDRSRLAARREALADAHDALHAEVANYV